MNKIKIGFILDPLESLNVDMDTSLLMVAEANKRGHEVYYTTLDELRLEKNKLFVNWIKLNYENQSDDLLASRNSAENKLASFCDAIIMRKDPPFDQRYLAATYLLDYADTLVLNSPAGLRAANEKLITFRWPEFTPRTIISNNAKTIVDLIKSEALTWVIKPLWECGGNGVFKVNRDSLDEARLIQATKNGLEYLVIQEFLERVYEGDKRAFLLNGEPIAWLNRVPAEGDFRANLHLGGKPLAYTPSKKELSIVKQVGADMKALDVPFIGLDLVGEYLTEVNITSPTCIPEMNLLDSAKYELLLVDYIEQRVFA